MRPAACTVARSSEVDTTMQRVTAPRRRAAASTCARVPRVGYVLSRTTCSAPPRDARSVLARQLGERAAPLVAVEAVIAARDVVPRERALAGARDAADDDDLLSGQGDNRLRGKEQRVGFVARTSTRRAHDRAVSGRLAPGSGSRRAQPAQRDLGGRGTEPVAIPASVRCRDAAAPFCPPSGSMRQHGDAALATRRDEPARSAPARCGDSSTWIALDGATASAAPSRARVTLHRPIARTTPSSRSRERAHAGLQGRHLDGDGAQADPRRMPHTRAPRRPGAARPVRHGRRVLRPGRLRPRRGSVRAPPPPRACCAWSRASLTPAATAASPCRAVGAQRSRGADRPGHHSHRTRGLDI